MYIKENNVHIWYIIFNDFDLLKINDFLIILNNEEKHKANSFTKEQDKNNYIISHGCLRLLLTKYHPEINAESWEFKINKYGKPSLSKKHKIKKKFNLSHTHSCAAIVFENLFECGIDIEEYHNLILNDSIINLVLSKKEQILYNTCTNKKDFFYKLWVIKESYVKALGIGIYQDFEKIDFSHILNIKLKNNNIFHMKKYCFFVWNISGNTWLSCCIIHHQEEKKISLYRLNGNINVSTLNYNVHLCQNLEK